MAIIVKKNQVKAMTSLFPFSPPNYGGEFGDQPKEKQRYEKPSARRHRRNQKYGEVKGDEKETIQQF